MEMEYSGTMIKANSNKNLVSGKRTVEIRFLVSSGSERKKLINALLAPNNAKNLASVSKLGAADIEVFLCRTLEIRTKSGTIFSFEGKIACLFGTTLTTKKPKSRET